MILADTSIWIDHLRAGDELLASLLNEGQILSHPAVIGELALGRLKSRDLVIGALTDLPQARSAADSEVLYFIDEHALAGSGIGYVDAQLLASVKLTAGSTLWTRDKRLHEIARRLKLAKL